MTYNLKIKIYQDSEFEFLLDENQKPMVFNTAEEATQEGKEIDLPFQVVEHDRKNSD